MRMFRALLVVSIVVLLGWSFTLSSPDISEGQNPQLVEFEGGSPQISLARGLQTQIDRVAEKSAQGQWAGASVEAERLEQMWRQWQPPQGTNLQIVSEIENHIEALQFNVWGRDHRGVINTSRELTELISGLG